MIFSKLDDIISQLPIFETMDEISISVIDFKENKLFKKVYNEEKSDSKNFYDLASLTKPLTIGLIQFIDTNMLNKDLKLILNHQAGIPAWGLLSKSSWRKQILSYEIKKSETVYSDFGAIRAQLEYESISSNCLYEDVREIWDDEILHWLDVDKGKCLRTGERERKPIIGDVHDPNAWVVKEKLSHAGLFGTLDGVSKTLLNLNNKFKMLEHFLSLLKNNKGRFLNGWDTATNGKDTLAGGMCGDKVVGHLGFTGTSFWFDCQKEVGIVILSNATRDGWYKKDILNIIRREAGNLTWAIR